MRTPDLLRVVLGSLGLLFSVSTVPAAETGVVSIESGFPGGNIAVTQNSAGTVEMAPDLRGGNPWFYWYFEAQALRPGRVRFAFPEKVAGFQHGAIGFQGPAISSDRGTTWHWMGTDNVDGSSFFYDFSEVGERVRFAVTMPYLETNLSDFLTEHAENRNLQRHVLTRTRHGREVELLQVGQAGPEVKAVLVTGRHHAAETMASFVLEGFLAEAISDSPAGIEFRKRYVLFAVPFVDKDGVEAGDQGKNRKPHDHNRDYGEVSIYPEVQAIKQLDTTYDFQFALDFHCPTLVMQDHQVMYFVGAKQHPPYNFQNVSEFAGWIKKGMPANAPHGPLVWLRDEDDPSPKNSRYFGSKRNAIMAATFEFPFSPPARVTDAASCKRYGRVVLQAWVNTHFRESDNAE